MVSVALKVFNMNTTCKRNSIDTNTVIFIHHTFRTHTKHKYHCSSHLWLYTYILRTWFPKFTLRIYKFNYPSPRHIHHRNSSSCSSRLFPSSQLYTNILVRSGRNYVSRNITSMSSFQHSAPHTLHIFSMRIASMHTILAKEENPGIKFKIYVIQRTDSAVMLNIIFTYVHESARSSNTNDKRRTVVCKTLMCQEEGPLHPRRTKQRKSN
jgi:hypothetical protein